MSGLVFLLFANKQKRRGWRIVIFYAVNVSAILGFIYSVALALYFQNYYMGAPFDVYPSLTFSIWYWNALIFLVAPLDMLYLVVYISNRINKWIHAGS